MATREQILAVREDKQSIASATKSLDGLDARLGKIAQHAKTAAAESRKMGDVFSGELARIGKSKDIDRLTEQTAKFWRDAGRAKDGVRELVDELQKLGATEDEVRRAAIQYERIISAQPANSHSAGLSAGALTNVAGLAGALPGGSAIGGGLRIGGDLLEAQRALPDLAAGIQDIGSRAAESATPLGAMASGLQRVLPGLSSSAAGLASMGLAAGVAVGAFALVSSALEKDAAAAERAAEARRHATEAALSASERYNEVVGEGTVEAAQRAAAAAEENITSIMNRLAEVEPLEELARVAEGGDLRGVGIITAIRALQDGNRAEADRILQDLFDVSLAQIERLGLSLNDLSPETITAKIEELRGALREEEITRDRVNQLIAGGTLTSEEAAAAEEKLAAERERAAATIAQLAEQERDLRDAEALRLDQLAEDRALRDQRAHEDYAMAVGEHQDRLASIHADGADRIAGIEAGAVESRIASERKASLAITKLQMDGQAAIAKLMDQFHQQSAKATALFNRDQLRAQEDLRDTLFEGELNNDVLAITLAKRRGEKEADRAREDFDLEADERAVARDERIAELREENRIRIEETKATLHQEREAINAALIERTAAEQMAITERADAEAASFAKSEERRAISDRRRQEDDDRADQRAAAAHERQLARIDERAQAEQAVLAQFGAGAQAVMQQLATSAQQALNALNPFSSGSGSRPGTQKIPDAAQRIRDTIANRFRPFEDGGIVPAGQQVLGLFEGSRPYDEAVLPLNDETLAKLGGGGPTIGTVIIGAGNNVTVEEVRQAFRDYARTQNQGFNTAIRGVQ